MTSFVEGPRDNQHDHFPFGPSAVDAKSGKGLKAFKFNSVGSQFKKQLGELMTQLNAMEPHYIRCIKPNSVNSPGNFENKNVLHQLRCGGAKEGAKSRSRCRVLAASQEL